MATNVKKGGGKGSVPDVYKTSGMEQVTTPNTISRQQAMGAGKARMNFKNKPLMPQQDLVGGEGIKHRSANPPLADGSGE